MSGVVFTVHEKSPHRELDGEPLYFCCESCAAHFDENRALVLERRGLAASSQPESQAANAQSPPGASPGAIPGLPPAAFEGIPGWLGFAATSPDTAAAPGQVTYGFSPTLSRGQVVIFADDWGKVPVGAQLVGLSRRGGADLNFLRSAEEPYGCNGLPTDMASFGAPSPLEEGPVWVLTPQDAKGAKPLPIKEVGVAALPAALQTENIKKPKRARVFAVGEALLVQEKTGDMTGDFWVAIDGEKRHTHTFEKYVMQGGDDSPLDLSAPPEIGLPQPIGAFSLKEGLSVVVLWSQAYEGSNFDILKIEGTAVTLRKAPYLYYCAF